MSCNESRRSAGDLPQQAETWHVAIPRLPIWITPPDEDPWRPFGILVVNLDSELVQTADTAEGFPTWDQVLEVLFSAMRGSPPGTFYAPHRPTHIQVEDAELAAALTPELEKINVTVQSCPRPELVDELIAEMGTSMRDGPEHPGLLSEKGVTPELVGGLFAAAAGFHRAAPWVQLTDEQPMAVHVPPERRDRYAIVMGAGGVEYGLVACRSWKDVVCLYDLADHPMEAVPADGRHTLFFDGITMVPFDDLEAIEQHRWEVVGEQAYPIPIVVSRRGDISRPSRADLRWYEATLLAIPIFVRDHLRPDGQGDYLPVDTTLSVPTHAGDKAVHVKYPAGALPSKETLPTDRSEWLRLGEDDTEEMPAFDRRTMEGTMAQFGGGFEDPDLQRAQDLMYQAWEESNPARRIILAHEALEICPDCADAYVLLAEEEAGTLGRALEYYQKGVEAGERALGKEYFEEEKAGGFWLLLETRPYMRARRGLANVLWELGRNEEAMIHYQDMLRLNRNDNQGIRYTLLNLLLEMGLNAEARRLLEEYEEDATAEWLYTRALLAFRSGGASQGAESALREALEMNRHVPVYLTGRKRIPLRLPPNIVLGDDSEAASYASAFLGHWRRTPGAVEWLGQASGSGGGQRRPKPSPSTRTKSPKPRKTKPAGRRRRRSSQS
ncbi:MAG: hypothetical protein H8E35_05375 [Ardenticatenia bacterium]|nr:hypothetical protein [Ardenticatenia bacterium]